MSFIALSHWRIALQAGWGLEFAIEGVPTFNPACDSLPNALNAAEIGGV
jgi:hypothetical protein